MQPDGIGQKPDRSTGISCQIEFRLIHFTAEVLERWQRWYGLPFRPLLDPGAAGVTQVSLVRTFVQPWTARQWPHVGPPGPSPGLRLRRSIFYAFCLGSDAVSGARRRPGRRSSSTSRRTSPRASASPRSQAASTGETIGGVPLWLLPSILEVRGGMKLLARSGFRNWSSTFRNFSGSPLARNRADRRKEKMIAA